MRSISAGFFVAMFLLCSQVDGTLHAYLDPGTGSIALQLLIGGVVAALATVRMYWARLRGFAGYPERGQPGEDAAGDRS
jgi:hypothetical protein